MPRQCQGILEEGLPPEEVDGLLGRNREIGGSEMSIWDQIQEIEPAQIGRFLNDEHPQTIAYVVSKLPPTFAAKTLVELPKELRANIVHRVVNMKPVNPNIADIIEQRVGQMLNVMESEQNSAVTGRVAEMMNEMDKPVVDELMGDLETISSADAARVKPKIFLFDDILEMPHAVAVSRSSTISKTTPSLWPCAAWRATSKKPSCHRSAPAHPQDDRGRSFGWRRQCHGHATSPSLAAPSLRKPSAWPHSTRSR